MWGVGLAEEERELVWGGDGSQSVSLTRMASAGCLIWVRHFIEIAVNPHDNMKQIPLSHFTDEETKAY